MNKGAFLRFRLKYLGTLSICGKAIAVNAIIYNLFVIIISRKDRTFQILASIELSLPSARSKFLSFPQIMSSGLYQEVVIQNKALPFIKLT